MDYTNVISATSTVTEADHKALAVAKRIERKRIKEGWRFYKINERMQVLVPFGKDGKPTEKGMKMIEMQKELQGIK